MAAAVTTQTFIAYTAADLEDEEMEVTTPPSLITIQQGHTPFSTPIHLMEPAPAHA